MLNKVLIVDDSEPLHQNYKVTLRRYKCDVITALSREDGLKKLTENTGVGDFDFGYDFDNGVLR
jgi:DNA-binding NtrC family response regulator